MGSDGGVWIGTRRAVYYRNNSMADWQLYNSGLPATTFSVQLFLNYRQGLVWNATNRSIHEAPLIEINPPLAQIAADKFTVDCFDNVVHFADNSAMSAQGASWQWTFPGGSPATSTLQNPVVTYNTPGAYNVTLKVTDAYGTNTQTLNAFITYANGADTVDLAQDFEPANYPATNWRLLNSAQTFDWQLVDVDAGPLCTASKAMRAENYYIEHPGDEAYLVSPRVSLAGIINPSLSYYYAYTGYNSSNDGLRVEVSTNCGSSWTQLFYAEGTDLLTTTASNDYFNPTNCNQWLQKVLNLDSYIGDTVIFRFAGVNDYGNNLYLDNINITGQPSALDTKPVELTSIFPNPSTGEFFILTIDKDVKLTVYNAAGQQVYSNRYQQGTHRFNLNAASGLYFAHIETQSGSEVIKLVVR
jgi:PKD repeat protein